METKKNKFAYDKEYYENYKNYSIVGNTAKKLDIVEEYEEDYKEDNETRQSFSYEEDYTPEKIQKPVREPKQKVRRVIKLNLVHVSMLLISIAAFVYSSFKYLEIQSDIVQMDKEIVKAEKQLVDIQAKNTAARNRIAEAYDRDYIYNVAVGRLGMIYPDEGQIIYYEASDEGYVRQYGSIPLSEKADILKR